LARLMSKPPAMTNIITYRHRPKRSPRKKPAKPEPIVRIVTAKRPRKRHYDEIIDDLPIRQTTKSPQPNAPGTLSSVG
jgi:hypothetical protein